MSADEWTVGRLLGWTSKYFSEHGADSPRLDAEVLLAHVRGCQRIDLYTAHEEVVAEDARAAFRKLVKERAAGTPVAYLVGEKEFYSLPFYVTPDVLIPRPETEDLVVALLDRAGESGGGRKIDIADVGTGSGILAVCAAKFLPEARVTAIDVSRAALDVARTNAERHGVSDRIEFLEGDLLAPVASREFDFIVSNPPYVSAAEFAELSPGVRDREPRGALLAGERGEEVIERLLPQAADRLRPGGWLLCEISPMIAERVAALAASPDRFEQTGLIKDSGRHDRILACRRR